jgi:hypothetical protein
MYFMSLKQRDQLISYLRDTEPELMGSEPESLAQVDHGLDGCENWGTDG